VPVVKQCLTHRHPYVRRNAVLTVFSIMRQFPDMYPDAVDDAEKFLEEETDPSARRNAFVMLFAVAQERAIAFLTRNLEKVLNYGDGFALILLELIRKLARSGGGGGGGTDAALAALAAHKAKFIRIVFSMLDNPSPAVSYEAAGTLTSLSATPNAVRAAAGAYIKTLTKEADNNVKLIILERLAALRKRHARVLREQVMDILRALSAPNVDIRKKTLDVAMDLVSPRNVDEVMAVLKKEVQATGAAGGGGSGGGGGRDPDAATYRGLLISAIHGCAVRFPEVASNVVQLLMDFLNGEGALPVIEFVREIVETFPEMRPMVLTKLRSVAGDISASEVHRVALWVLGQYSQSAEEVAAALHTIRECIGPLPLTMGFSEFAAGVAAAAAGAAGGGEGKEGEGARAGAGAGGAGGRPVVLADGTYASQSGLTEGGKAGGGKKGGEAADEDTPVPALRLLLLAGDFYLGSVVASTLTKLALRTVELAAGGRESRHAKTVLVDSLLVMCSIMELGGSGLAGTPALLPVALMPAVSGRSYGSARPPGGGGGGGSGGAGAVPGAAGAAGGAPGGAPGAAAAAAAAAALSPSGIRIDQDSFERIALCIHVLGDPTSSSVALPVLLHTCRDTFRGLLLERRARAAQAVADGVAAAGGGGAGVSFSLGAAASATAGGKAAGGEAGGAPAPAARLSRARADDALSIRALRTSKGGGAFVDDFSGVEDVDRAAGTAVEDFSDRLKRVHQLTGFADPVYCEAYVRVHEFDIVMELLVINRTDITLTNVALELSVMGDLKLVDRPPLFTLGPRDSRTLKANIKVASTETGHIFGTIAYNAPASPNDQIVINLVEIHVDIMDYIHPATCSDAAFRSMWADFEWENKVSINTNISCVRAAGPPPPLPLTLFYPPPPPFQPQQLARVRPAHFPHDQHAHPNAHRRPALHRHVSCRQPLRALHIWCVSSSLPSPPPLPPPSTHTHTALRL
jgi:vesicle coat complex subunit